MNGETTASQPQPLDAWFLDLLACPGCEQHLPLHPVHSGEGNTTLVCHCGRYAFPVRDGIPILLVEEATILSPDASPDSA